MAIGFLNHIVKARQKHFVFLPGIYLFLVVKVADCQYYVSYRLRTFLAANLAARQHYVSCPPRTSLVANALSAVQQQQAEYQREQSNCFYDTNDNEVVGRTFSGGAQSICSSCSTLTLEQSRKTDGQTAEDTNAQS